MYAEVILLYTQIPLLLFKIKVRGNCKDTILKLYLKTLILN